MSSPSLPARQGFFDRPYLLLLATTLMWGGNAVAGRMAVGEMSPMVLTCLRWLIACCLLLLIAHRQMARDWAVLKDRLPWLFAMGTVGFTFFNGLFYVAAHYTLAVNITILQGSMPAMVMLGMFFLYGIRISGLQAAGLVVTLLGVLAIASGGDIHALLHLRLNIGDLMMLVASVFYAAYTIAMRGKPQASPLGLFGFIAIAAFLSSLPFAIGETVLGLAVWPHDVEGLAILAFVAIFPSLVAQVFFIRAIEIIGPNRAGLFINLVPVFGALLAVAILGEPFGLHHGIALVLVCLGIILAERGRTPLPVEPEV